MDPAPTPEPTHPDDLRLTRDALAGDTAARDEFVRRMACVPRMLASMNARVGRPLGPQDLEDLAQDVLVTLWRRLETFRGMASLETWTYRFCFFELSNKLQFRRGKPQQYQVEPEDAIAEPRDDLAEFEALYRALERLDGGTADVIRLKVFDQWTFEELAAHMDASANTIKARYYRGLTRMRELLGPHRDAFGKEAS